MPIVATLFALATAVAAMVTVRCWGRRGQAPAVWVTGICAASMTMWNACELLLLFTRDPGRAESLRLASLLGTVGAVSAFACLTRLMVDRSWAPTRRFLSVLAIEPALLVLAIATNPAHRLIVRGVHREPGGYTWLPDYGPLFWVNAAYTHAMAVFALWPLIRSWNSLGGRYRRAYRHILLVIAPPIVANAVWVSGLYRTINLTVLGVMVTMLGAYRLVIHRYMDFGPVAHQRVFHSVSDAVLVVDDRGVILDANPAAVALSDRVRPDGPVELIGRRVGRELAGLMAADQPEVETTLPDVWGSGIDLQVYASRLSDRRGRALGWTLVGRDVTEMNREQEQLSRANERLTAQLRTIEALRADLAEQAVRDPLTGLYNRRYLMRRLEEALGDPASAPLSVAIIDLDHFKRVNDVYGHPAGDQVLVLVARSLSSGVRPSDALARHGGEEFVLMMPRTSAEQAWRLVDSLRRRVAATPLDVLGRRLSVSFSAGVGTRRTGESHTALLHVADGALYEAKRLGRDRVVAAGGPRPVVTGGPAGRTPPR